MKTSLSRVLRTLLVLTALAVIVPGVAMASPWCNQCNSTGDCFACCKCDGGTARQCADECGSSASLLTGPSFLTDSTCEAPQMSVAAGDDVVEEETAEVTVASAGRPSE